MSLVALFGAVAPAHAAPDDVEQLLSQGIEQRKQGNDEAAYRFFLRAFEAEKSPRTGSQLALAEQALGRWIDADEHLRAALAAGDDPWIVQHRAALEDAARFVAEHVGELDVHGPAGTQLRINGRLIAVLPIQKPLRLVAERVELEASLRSHSPIVRVVTIGAGRLYRETFTWEGGSPAPATAAPQLVTAPRPPTRRTTPLYKRWWLWSTVGAVAVGLGLGIGLGLGLQHEPVFPQPK
jgi:hypothetical protein